jgi:hypothetical protein
MRRPRNICLQGPEENLGSESGASGSSSNPTEGFQLLLIRRNTHYLGTINNVQIVRDRFAGPGD